jgi:hypothetical protein
VLLVVRVHPAGEVTEVDEQAQAGQPLGKVAGLPDVASWCWPAVRDEVSATDGGRRPVARTLASSPGRTGKAGKIESSVVLAGHRGSLREPAREPEADEGMARRAGRNPVRYLRGHDPTMARPVSPGGDAGSVRPPPSESPAGVWDQQLILDPVTQQTLHFISRNRPNSKS